MNILIVGCGLAGCVLAERFSHIANVTLVETRNHIGGNCYDYYNEAGILIHKYGPHIFHTNISKVWNYLSKFTSWRYYKHITQSYANGTLHLFPLSESEVTTTYLNKANAETYLISSIGKGAYEKFFKNYTIKQWGIEPKDLPYEIVARIPARPNGDIHYFTDRFQGMPKYGYTEMIKNMLDGKNIRIVLQCNGKEFVKEYKADLIIWTGRIDDYYDYQFGVLPYRSLRFEHETLNEEYHLPVGHINYPNDFDFTRILEWKYLTGQKHYQTTITREYPCDIGDPFYPVNIKNNVDLYLKYADLASKEKNVYFIGRLAEYKYYNMDSIIDRCITYAAI